MKSSDEAGPLPSDECLLKALNQFGILCHLNGELSKCLVPCNSGGPVNSRCLAVIGRRRPAMTGRRFAGINRRFVVIGRRGLVMIDRRDPVMMNHHYSG